MDGEQKLFQVATDELLSSGKKLTKPAEKQAFDPNTQDKFNTALANPTNSATQVQQAEQLDGTRPNPLEVAKNVYAQKTDSYPSIDTIEQNVKKASNKIDQIKETLQSPDVNIKSSYQSLLENKLIHINENLRVALERVGIESGTPTPPATAPITSENGIQTAVQKFLDFLSNSQSRLQQVTDDVNKYRTGQAKGQMSPGDMLSIQLKIAYVQQELELFSNLLNKALDSTKTLMNVQI